MYLDRTYIVCIVFCNILRLVIIVWRTQGLASDLDADLPASVDSVQLLAADLLRRQRAREEERLREEEEAARREEVDPM